MSRAAFSGQIIELVIGAVGGIAACTLWSAISPESFAQPLNRVVTSAVMVPFLLVAGSASFTVYRRTGGYDRVTAFYSSMPSGLNEMLLLGAIAGGYEKRIAMAHAARILVVIFVVAVFFGVVMGVTSRGENGPVWTALSDLTARDWAPLAGAAALGVPLGRGVRLSTAKFLGPMLLSGMVHLTRIVKTPPPSGVVIVAQIVLGTVIGSRFIDAKGREIGYDLMLGALSTVAMFAVVIGFAALIGALTDIPTRQAFLPTHPEG